MLKQYLFLSICLICLNTLQAQHKKDTLSTFDLEKCFNQNLSEPQRAEYKNAIYNYSQELKKEPQKAELYLNRGNAYAGLGLFPDAITDYNKALRIDSLFPEAYYNRGVAKARFAYTKNACTDVKRAAELGLNISTPLYNDKCKKYIKDLGERKKTKKH